MDPFEKALLGDAGGRLLDILASPYATALMWVLPVMFEIALVWLLVYAYRRRKAFKDRPGLPGEPVGEAKPRRDPLLVRARRD